ncbi:MAG: GDSL-type esterase/lipase family protein, partial [Bacteroidota bacterium]
GDNLFQIAKRFACSVPDIQRWNDLRNTQIFAGQTLQVKKPISETTEKVSTPSELNFKTTFTLNTASAGFQLTGAPQGKGPQKKAVIYGARLEDTQARGIQYHAAGVNGATYYHFLKGEYFLQQIPDLQPDLIIITLGTNEALQKRYEEGQIENTIDAFLQQIKATLPRTAILICIAPDALISKKYPASNIPKIRQQLIAAAQKHQTAYWDFYRIMGGQGSIRQWKSMDLAYHDFIHFTQKGYILQGGLLYEALRKTYAKH